MGLRGRTRQPRNWTVPGSREFYELINGPEGTSDEHEWTRSFPRIRRRWRAGGREAVMSWREWVGIRPLAWWLARSPAERRLADQCRCEAEALIKLKLAGADERQEIADRGLVTQQVEWMKQDALEHPEDYLP